VTSRTREETAAKALRALLLKRPVGFSFLDDAAWDDLRRVESSLEFFLPEVLAKIYSDWERESLDGFYFTVARKTDEFAAEFFGLCIIITDQTLTPIHLCLEIAENHDEVTRLECRLGELGENGMVRTPYRLKPIADKRVIALDGWVDRIDWVYKAGFDRRRK
jgi:hypothetical protein